MALFVVCNGLSMRLAVLGGLHRLAQNLQILALFYRHSEVRGGTGTTFFLN